MIPDSALKLLLVHDSFEEANRIVSLLRNANYRAESKHVNQEEVLSKLLQEKPWDMIIGQYQGENTPIKSIFSLIRRFDLDTPVILISEQYNVTEIVEGLRLGAADVLPMDEDQQLLLVVARTLFNLEQRRLLRQFRRRYADAENRCERLLGSSVDAIAIIQEGTYLFTNDSFAQLFGHLENDSMLCLPVIDTIAPEDHARLREYLRPIDKDEEIPLETLRFTGITNDEIPIPIEAKIAKVDYQGEPALELVISRQFLDGQVSAGDDQGAEPSGAMNIQRDKVIELINNAIRLAAQKHSSSVLLYITLDRYSSILAEIGIQKTEELVSQLVDKIRDASSQDVSLMRFKEDTLVMIMPNTGTDAALMFANQLCETVGKHIFQLGEQTFTLTLGIGASVISETVATAEGCIEKALSALTDLHQKNNGDFANGANLYQSEIGPEYCEEDVEEAARAMLEDKLFELLYQPIIPLQGKQEQFYEVFIQTKPEADEKVLPDNFIAKVFKTDAARDIDHWVILESFKALSEKLKSAPTTRLFINICSHTLTDEGFIPWLKVALKASGLYPKNVIFQLREIDVARQYHRSVELIEELSKINGDVALSHFGLAIEPMKLLQNLSVNYIKFDSVIIEKAYQNDESLAELKSLISSLKIENEQIIVPFVERADMIPILWTCGVHYIQGHFLQPPSQRMNYDFSDDDN